MTSLIYFGKSTRDKKRFVAVFDNPRRTVHFGLLDANTYIDGADKSVRSNYLKRHSKVGFYLKWGQIIVFVFIAIMILF